MVIRSIRRFGVDWQVRRPLLLLTGFMAVLERFLQAAVQPELLC